MVINLEIRYCDHYLCQKLIGMLLLLGLHLIDNDSLSEWINSDAFGYTGDPSNGYLVTELNKLKGKFVTDIHEKTVIKDKNGEPLSPLEIYNLIDAHKNRIEKVRLMLKGDILIAEHLHKPSEVTYLVARSYWLDNKGKKFRKFSKNLGPKSSVVENGKIPEWKMKEIKKELEGMMWKHYQEEYSVA